MPNLLKSLPREILQKEDSKFIYNVLNPLLFDKIKETDEDITITHTVSSLLNKDINLSDQFLPEYILPYNINSREFHVYMTDGQENTKIKYFGKTDLIRDLDDLKDYIYFYFGMDGYGFLYEIIKRFYNVKNEYEKNKSLYEHNYKKYLETVDVRKKKVYKSTYEHFKELHDSFNSLKTEFDLIMIESNKHDDYSINQLLDNYAKELGNHLGIKTFDNEIIFKNSKLFAYLTEGIRFNPEVNKHIFSGKNIINTQKYTVNNVFELIAVFAMEVSSIQSKYDQYLKLIVDNGNGFALKRSEHRKLKNEKYTDVVLNLDSDNLTFSINEKENKLEIYVYFLKDYRIDESTFKLVVNEEEIPPSIHSLTGKINYGYTLFEYFDETTKYYKITVHDYLQYDLDDMHLNYDINDISTTFNIVKAFYQVPSSPQELYLETSGFLDNFIIYRKNASTGFFEAMNVPYKVKIGIDEKMERYIRTIEFVGIDTEAHIELISQDEIIIGCYDYDYFYEPKIYVDFFKYLNNEISFRYNTIIPYVLIDDVMGEDFELMYYAENPINEYSTNIHKNITMYNGKTYRKLFDDINQMRILNPYNESNYEYVSKISYNSYRDRVHTNPIIISGIVSKIPFRDNLKYLDKLQIDLTRDAIVFMHRGIQKIVPTNEKLIRNLNCEHLSLTKGGKVLYHGEEICGEGFRYLADGIYLRNPITSEHDLIEAVPTEQINLSTSEKEIFFDMYEMTHCIIINKQKYKIDGLYVDTYLNAIKSPNPVMFVESKYGIPRYKTVEGKIIDIDFSRKILDDEDITDGSITYDAVNKKLIFRNTPTELYSMNLIDLEVQKSKHRQLGMTAFSIYYSGNVLPENSNKTFFGRENIYSSLSMPDVIYNIGKSGDKYDDVQQHALLAEQLDLDVIDADKFNLEHEPYLMFKSKTASLKGLESYLKSSLKSISQDIGISPVYLIQRNRFISEWARVSTVLPEAYFGVEALKELVADLMETKLLNHNYDDLMDIFKNNEYEKFSIDTNNIHNILVQYIIRFLQYENIYENFTYYLIHVVWIGNNRKKILDFIKANADQQTIREISEMKFETDYEREQLFYIFVRELGKIKKTTIESYIPIANYSDWKLYLDNNAVKFEKPYKYEIIDISDFISMPIEWKQPLCMIRPLTEDDVFVKRDYRFLDISIATNSQITYNDAYNEYVEDIKNKLNKPISYVGETLSVLHELSMEDGFDMLGVNLVVVRWIAERFLPTYMTGNAVETAETFREIIKTELSSADHPNLIVSYNKIKETALLGDLGSTVNDIVESITTGNLVTDTIVRLNITDKTELEYLDKVKKPLEHYFDYMFSIKRHDIITKVLALFTEDVIATSMIDLSFAINIKNTKGDETFNIYEQMIYDIFDEFLPFHTVLDKIIFTIKVMESRSGEAISKELETKVKDTYLIDIVTYFTEKIKIHTSDNIIFGARLFIPSIGLKLCGGHDEIPYDYDRKVKVAGHDIPPHMDDYEMFGVDDEWYVINRDERWLRRVEEIPTPPQYADFWWDCGTDNPMEQVAETNITDYYKIKTAIFERDDRIESHFIDSVPIIDITQGVSETPDIDVIEDYLIHIDSVYKIKFYDMELIGHDEFGQDEAWGPEDQSALIGIREGMMQSIMHDFYDKLNIAVIDSIWTDIVVVHDLINIPGHDDFGIDEYYHQSSPERLDHEISAMVYDSLLETGFDIRHIDMSDVSLVDNKLAVHVDADFRELIMNTVVSDNLHVTIDIITNRHFDAVGHFLRPAHDEFLYDEYYHNSTDPERADNMADIIMGDYMGHIRIDFGFMRMLPFDPYIELINQQFYRANLPGSDYQLTRIKDKFSTDVHTFSKDIIRIGLMDFYTLDLIDEELRRKVYNGVEEETFGGDSSISIISDGLISRNFHYDFRENIIAIDRYATVLDDAAILSIYGTRAAQVERDGLFKLQLGDTVYSTIKHKHPVDRSMTKFDKDYLKSIKIEEENFVEFKYMDREINVRFTDTLSSFLRFNDRVGATLTYQDRYFIEQYNAGKLKVGVLDRLHYGHHHSLEIDGMMISASDILVQAWSNKIHRDSMVISLTDTDLLKMTTEFLFGSERIYQPHDMYGQMGYTDESINRTIESKLTDSLIQVSDDFYFDKASAEIYDGLMHNVGHYFGDHIDVVLGDSIHTYIHIVKQPWIFPEFDNFGHDSYPHMYNGDGDEFGITAQLRESILQDAYAKVYDAGALVRAYERIYTGFGYEVPFETTSVSMVDDLKIIDVRTHATETTILDTKDIFSIDRFASEPKTNITVQDKIWYGYKMRDDWVSISASDKVMYAYYDKEDIKRDSINATVRDWLLVEYTFIDDRPNIKVTDRITYDSLKLSPKDIAPVALKDSLEYKEFTSFDLFDKARVYITDKVFINRDTQEPTYTELIETGSVLKDALGVAITETKFTYGPGKKLREDDVTIGLSARSNIFERSTFLAVPEDSMTGVELTEALDINVIRDPIKDHVGVGFYERMKFGPIFKDRANVFINENFRLRLSWMADRYGVDIVPHSESEMEYYNDSADRSVAAGLYEDIKIVDIHTTLGESLIILSSDQLAASEKNKGTDFQISAKSDGIVVASNDNLMYGIGMYDHIWDAKEWSNYGYTIPYEKWQGHIPHDDFPYDEMEHSDQGNDLSQVNTGITENLLYGFDFLFKDTLTVQAKDDKGFESWGYQSVFKDRVMVYTANRLRTDWMIDRDNNDTMINFTNESITVSYEFEGNIKSHRYIEYNNQVLRDEINIYDKDTYQLIEGILRYRIYESIDVSINADLLSTVLFKYDDELSLITDYMTKIDLYKAKDDGSVTKSMTVIKDKTTEKVMLLFNDGVFAAIKDKLHGTEALRPDEYLG